MLSLDLKIRSLIFFLFLPLALPAQKKSDEVLFSVNKRPVTIDEFRYLYNKNNTGRKEEYTEKKIDDYLTLFINFKLKVEEARHRGLDTTATFRKEFNTYRDELRKPYLPDAKMIDSLTALTYERMKHEIRAEHILINLPADPTPADTTRAWNRIMELRTRALDGEDFETLALNYSEDPTAKANHGLLGWFTALQMVFPFEQVAFTTPIGQISQPVRTQFGYHIIKTLGERPASGEVEVSHIMLRAGTDEENRKAENTAFEIIDKLQKGVSWNDLCKEYSDDQSSKDNGGKLRPFGPGVMANVPQFEEAAFALKKPGDISDPVHTQFGWHLIRLERKIPLPSFEEVSASLKSRVSRDERAQISKQAVQKKMKREFAFSENSAVRDNAFAQADSSLTRGSWKIKDPMANNVIFSIREKPVYAGEFLQFVLRNQKAGSVSPHQQMQTLYQRFTDEKLGLAFEDKIKQEHPDYAFLLNEYYEGILLFEIMEKEVWNKASEDSVGQRNYYQAHQKEYMASDRARATIYSSAVKSAIDKMLPVVQGGDSVAIHAYATKEKIRKDIGTFEKSDRVVFSKINWTPGVYLAENNNMHYLVWVKSMIPPGIKSFDDARASVISDYQNTLEKEWIAQLRKTYDVKVNKKAKQKLIDQLVQR